MLSGGDSKKDGRAEPKAKERSEAELRNPRQRMEEGCGFLQPKRMHAKSQTLPDLPRRLGAPRQRALRRGSRIMPKKSATAGGTTLSLCPFPAARQMSPRLPRIRMHFVTASQRLAQPSSLCEPLGACSSFESLRPFSSRLSHIARDSKKPRQRCRCALFRRSVTLSLRNTLAVASGNHKKPRQRPHPSPPHSSPTLRSG